MPVEGGKLGRDDHFLEYKEKLKNWVGMERVAGWAIDKTEWWLEFKDYVLEAIGGFHTLEEAGRASESDVARRELLSERIDDVQANNNYYKPFMRDLMSFCQCRFLKPQRLINLPPVEEQFRAMNTWRFWDQRLWLTAFGAEAELKAYVAEPVVFKQNVAKTVLGFSDQIPFWIGLCWGTIAFGPRSCATQRNKTTGWH